MCSHVLEPAEDWRRYHFLKQILMLVGKSMPTVIVAAILVLIVFTLVLALCFILLLSPSVFICRYIWAGLLVLFGIFLNVYSKNRENMKLPSVKDLRSWLLTRKKVQFLSQNV